MAWTETTLLWLLPMWWRLCFSPPTSVLALSSLHCAWGLRQGIGWLCGTTSTSGGIELQSGFKFGYIPTAAPYLSVSSLRPCLFRLHLVWQQYTGSGHLGCLLDLDTLMARPLCFPRLLSGNYWLSRGPSLQDGSEVAAHTHVTAAWCWVGPHSVGFQLHTQVSQASHWCYN